MHQLPRIRGFGLHKGRISVIKLCAPSPSAYLNRSNQNPRNPVQSQLHTICVLRFIMQISCRRLSFVEFFIPASLSCYCCMACGLEKIFLFNLFMNEAKGAGMSWVVGLVGLVGNKGVATHSPKTITISLVVPTALSHR